MKSHRQISSAFSLIEVLVVIAIIVLLAALLLPALSSTKEKARTVACMSNLKQIHACISLYTFDHDGYFGVLDYVEGDNDNGVDSIFGVLVSKGYLNATVESSRTEMPPKRSVLYCPSGIYALSQPTIKPGDSYARPWSSWDPEVHKATAWKTSRFGLNGYIHGWYGVNGSSGSGANYKNPFTRSTPDPCCSTPTVLHRRQEVTNPTQLIIFYDGVWAHNNWTVNDRISARHYRAADTNALDGATNFIMFDGHCETMATSLVPSPSQRPATGPSFKM